jgi:predicted Zn-dependent protease with MMP-like domain
VAGARARGHESAELDYLEGVARADLEEWPAAERALSRAAEPDWPDARLAHAWVLFRLCRFDEAGAIVRLLVTEEAPWDAWLLHGLLEERRGETREADAAFQASARRAPEGEGPSLLRIERSEFERITELALEALPANFREALGNVAILVRPFPDADLLTESEPPLDPESLGLFTGTNRAGEGPENTGALPSVILLFQRNLERVSRTREELEREIAITLYHEIGHYLGFEEDDMPRLGLE